MPVAVAGFKVKRSEGAAGFAAGFRVGTDLMSAPKLEVVEVVEEDSVILGLSSVVSRFKARRLRSSGAYIHISTRV